MKRFSVLYQLKEQYYHVGCATAAEARTVLQRLATDPKRTPVGTYDAKTELFEWAPIRQQEYDQAMIGEQGKRDEQIVLIAQALRRRDSSWQVTGDFRRPNFFA